MFTFTRNAGLHSVLRFCGAVAQFNSNKSRKLEKWSLETQILEVKSSGFGDCYKKLFLSFLKSCAVWYKLRPSLIQIFSFFSSRGRIKVYKKYHFVVVSKFYRPIFSVQMMLHAFFVFLFPLSIPFPNILHAI